MRQTELKYFRMLVLSDLHFCEGTESEVLNKCLPGGDISSVGWPEKNTRSLFRIISEAKGLPRPDHVIVLGDITTMGLRQEFHTAKRVLIDFQNSLLVSGREKVVGDGQLDSDFITVIPGNHDLTKLTSTTIGFLRDFLKGLLPRSKKRPNTKKMQDLLREFDSHFGGTISVTGLRPSQNPEQFGKFEKELPTTNIRLVPLNSLSAFPVTSFGRNAQGEMDNDQLGRLSKLDGGGPNGKEPFRIALMHHFPLPVPAKEDDSITKYLPNSFRTLETLKNAELVVNKIYLSSNIVFILCGHRHTDFIWRNSVNVPEVRRCMPVITIGSFSFRHPDLYDLRFCVIEIEDRNLTLCSPDTTFVLVKYYKYREGGGLQRVKDQVGVEEFCNSPMYYNKFIETTRESISKAVSAAGSRLIRFINFSATPGQNSLHPLAMGNDETFLEFSRWGTRMYGETDNRGEELIVNIPETDIPEPISVELHCRRFEKLTGNPEVQIVCDGERGSFVRVEDLGSVSRVRVKRFSRDSKVRIRFRCLDRPGEVVLHCLLLLKP